MAEAAATTAAESKGASGKLDKLASPTKNDKNAKKAKLNSPTATATSLAPAPASASSSAVSPSSKSSLKADGDEIKKPKGSTTKSKQADAGGFVYLTHDQ